MYLEVFVIMHLTSQNSIHMRNYMTLKETLKPV